MEQAGEVDYLITWRDEFVGRVSLTPWYWSASRSNGTYEPRSFFGITTAGPLPATAYRSWSTAAPGHRTGRSRPD
ncbi:hypothetical protein EV644_10610 [Kribbella orskensis]|uniref:Uncharacterized protein n=1 Tax=Kribbella orskensis TaxID=2512216 RepID=A0ABY2BJF5_9ACTN|nr:hypothetical protein EV642_10510 [Kribbella sp. VKM Ac-2500]TCO22703.1 hypothetical protein EV644_10610 [Kribbella orskensis]